MQSGKVVELRPGARAAVAPLGLDAVDATIPDKPGPAARVQIRLSLETLEQTERDLLLLRGAVDRALTAVRHRNRDPASLAAVRQIFAETNHAVNCRRQGR